VTSTSRTSPQDRPRRRSGGLSPERAHGRRPSAGRGKLLLTSAAEKSSSPIRGSPAPDVLSSPRLPQNHALPASTRKVRTPQPHQHAARAATNDACPSPYERARGVDAARGMRAPSTCARDKVRVKPMNSRLMSTSRGPLTEQRPVFSDTNHKGAERESNLHPPSPRMQIRVPRRTVVHLVFQGTAASHHPRSDRQGNIAKNPNIIHKHRRSFTAIAARHHRPQSRRKI